MKLVHPIDVAVVTAFILIMSVGAIGACSLLKDVPSIVGGGAPLVACVVKEVEGGDETFEGIAAACGVQAIDEIVGIVETISSGTSLPPTTAAKAVRVHHKGVK
jgi:hypothetical protein